MREFSCRNVQDTNETMKIDFSVRTCKELPYVVPSKKVSKITCSTINTQFIDCNIGYTINGFEYDKNQSILDNDLSGWVYTGN